MTELIRRIDRERFAVHVACFRREGVWLPRIESAGIPITEFPLRSFRSPAALRIAARFARWCRNRRIAVLQACDLYANIFALPASAFARVPLRLGSRRGIVAPNSTPGLLRLQRASYRFAHGVVANSRAAASRLVEEGVPHARVTTIANGIEIDRFPAAGPRARRRVITTVANLRAGKGHEVLLRAAARIVRLAPDTRFEFVGDGPKRGELETLAASLRLSNHVTFLGQRDDVPAILGASDIFAFPSFMEAFPNGVLEAMAVGLPVVATRVGGIPEVVEHGRNGLLVPPGDDRALAAALLDVMRQPALADALGDAARTTVASGYSFERMVSEFENLYLRELTAGRAAAGVPEMRSGAAEAGPYRVS